MISFSFYFSLWLRQNRSTNHSTMKTPFSFLFSFCPFSCLSFSSRSFSFCLFSCPFSSYFFYHWDCHLEDLVHSLASTRPPRDSFQAFSPVSCSLECSHPGQRGGQAGQLDRLDCLL